MERIENEILEREFINNYGIHEVFEYQSTSDLDNLVKSIKDSNEILLQININNIIPFYKHRNNFKDDSEEESKYWNHIISILFMTQLKEKYNLDMVHDLEEEKKIITREPFETYQQYESALLDRNDFIEAIRNLNLDNTRVHIVIRSFNNENVWKELLNYLEDNLPFITMIYSDGDMSVGKTITKEEELPTNNYKYRNFERCEEGLTSYKLLTDKQYKKVLKNESKI